MDIVISDPWGNIIFNNKLRVEIGFLYLEVGSELEQTFDRLYAPACIQDTLQDVPKTIFKN